jgi:hypothetical protein
VYPSHYEGWGLPVTESLCYGRIPLVANNSSLPEAGAGFAIVFEDDSRDGLVSAVELVTFEDTWRERREAEIARDFRPRTWTQIANQIHDEIIQFVGATGQQPIQAGYGRDVRLGSYYPTRLYKETQIWNGLASGEIFRAGDGWLWPETEGCRTKPEGGELHLTVVDPTPVLRLYLLLKGVAEESSYSIEANGQVVVKGHLRPYERRWALADIHGVHGDLRLFVKGSASEIITMSTGGTVKHLEAGLIVLGFLLCDAEDEDARAAFLEVAALGGNVETISAYRDAALTDAHQ